jgi:hypothetical protein
MSELLPCHTCGGPARMIPGSPWACCADDECPMEATMRPDEWNRRAPSPKVDMGPCGLSDNADIREALEGIMPGPWTACDHEAESPEIRCPAPFPSRPGETQALLMAFWPGHEKEQTAEAEKLIYRTLDFIAKSPEYVRRLLSSTPPDPSMRHYTPEEESRFDSAIKKHYTDPSSAAKEAVIEAAKAFVAEAPMVMYTDIPMGYPEEKAGEARVAKVVKDLEDSVARLAALDQEKKP